MNFFNLSEQQVEDKVVIQQARIYADVLQFGKENSFNVTTTSKAYKQKLKFFLDAIKVRKYDDDYDADTNPGAYRENTYRIGRYYEVEDLASVQLNNSAGFYSFTYLCDENDGNGGFDFRFEFENIEQQDFWLYISNLNFTDSFYNSNNSWNNENNPDYIGGDIVREENQNLPDGAELNDFLVQGSNGPEWKSGQVVTDYLRLSTRSDDTIPEEAKPGIVTTDERTIDVSAGRLYVNIDNDTLYYDEDEKFLKAKGSSGAINYSLDEQDTGLKWIDGKTVYQKTFTNVTASSVLVPAGVADTLISSHGLAKNGTLADKVPVPYGYNPNYCIVQQIASGEINFIANAYTPAYHITIQYTKL